MKVTLRKQGGLAGGIQWPPTIVELSKLSGSVASELTQLVAAVKATPAPENKSPGRARDSMTFTITIDEDGGDCTIVEQSDTAMSPSFVALLEWLENSQQNT